MNAEKEKRMLSPERMARLDGEKLIARLGLKGDETLVDAGAGPGAFTFRFAEQLPEGRVFAVDIDAALLKSIAVRAAKEKRKNIAAVSAKALDIPAGTADIVFCCTVLHEVAEKQAFIAAYFGLLKKGGKIYIAEFKSGKRTLTDDDNVRRTFIAPERTEALLTSAGFSAEFTEIINPLIYLTSAIKP